MAAADYYPLTQLVYIAYFGRPADPAGLRAFAASLDSLGAPTSVAGLSAQYGVPANAALRALVDGFGASAESTKLYSAGSTADFVRSVFDNILHRAPAAAGLAFWSAELDSGRVGKAEAALRIMAGAFLNTTNPQQAALDQQTIGSKVAAASYFTDQVDAQHYRGESAAWQARFLLSQVDSLNQPALFRPAVDSVVRQIAGQEPVTAPLRLANGASYIGNEADEQVLVGSQVGKVATGSGNDTVFLNGSSVSGTLDGGAGSDTLVMSGADAVGANLSASIAGFERLPLTSVMTESIDMDRLDGIAEVAFGGTNLLAVNGAVLDKLASGGTVAVNGGATAFTVNVKNAATGSSDVLDVSTAAAKGVTLGTITIPHVETINVRTVDTEPASQDYPPTLSLVADDATTLSLSGPLTGHAGSGSNDYVITGSSAGSCSTAIPASPWTAPHRAASRTASIRWSSWSASTT